MTIATLMSMADELTDGKIDHKHLFSAAEILDKASTDNGAQGTIDTNCIQEIPGVSEEVDELVDDDKPKVTDSAANFSLGTFQKEDNEKIKPKNEVIIGNPLFSVQVLPENATVWELMKAQIEADFKPFLILIPTPVKTFIARRFKASTTLLLKVTKGAFSPMLNVLSKLLRHMAGKITSLAITLDSLALHKGGVEALGERSAVGAAAHGSAETEVEEDDELEYKAGEEEVLKEAEDTEEAEEASDDNEDEVIVEL